MDDTLLSSNIANCIGCGCTDQHACINAKTHQPCSWLAVDRVAKLGVCSECASHLKRWNAGDRLISLTPQ